MWIIWLCCIVVALAVLTVLISIRLPIDFEYAASAERKKQMFQIRICRIRLIRNKKKKTGAGKGTEAEKTAEKAHKNMEPGEWKKEKSDEFGFSQFMERLDRVKHIYELIQVDIEDVFSYLGTRSRCRNLTVHLDFGFSDAAQTGIAAGVAYGVVYGFAGLVYNKLPLRKDDMDIAVTPHFNRQCADLYIKSIFCLSIAHIIKVLMMLLAIHKKIKEEIKQ